ncbi:hypothetical protein D9613_007327 [Agrocybe pediades]|uniref:Hydrophobin n=1 Tax=Agrocybe pediades TaxID=84607 RepID=A0A8H4VIM4_9AGAR|nr:hypothetical protein D9613_007327 [Agrocybe pediades]KAF9551425.1 hypothetical protein CPC08DRAFT_715063 [Agrocybe pediades]
MRTFALVTLILPALVAAQIACDSGEALCCFDVEDATPDNLLQVAQLNALDQTTFPTSAEGSVGLLCTALDDTCTTTQLCCTDNNYNGVAALGCSAVPSSASRK